MHCDHVREEDRHVVGVLREPRQEGEDGTGGPPQLRCGVHTLPADRPDEPVDFDHVRIEANQRMAAELGQRVGPQALGRGHADMSAHRLGAVDAHGLRAGAAIEMAGREGIADHLAVELDYHEVRRLKDGWADHTLVLVPLWVEAVPVDLQHRGAGTQAPQHRRTEAPAPSLGGYFQAD